MRTAFILLLLFLANTCPAQRVKLGFTVALPFNYGGEAKNVRSNFSGTAGSAVDSYTSAGFSVRNNLSFGIAARYRTNERLFFGAHVLYSGFSYYAGGSFPDTSYFPAGGGLMTKAGFTLKYRQYIPGLETSYRIVKIGSLDLFLRAKASFRIAELVRLTPFAFPRAPVAMHHSSPDGKWKVIPEGVLGLQLGSLNKREGQLLLHIEIGYSFRSLQRMHLELQIPDRTASSHYYKFIEYTPRAHWMQIGATYYLG